MGVAHEPSESRGLPHGRRPAAWLVFLLICLGAVLLGLVSCPGDTGQEQADNEDTQASAEPAAQPPANAGQHDGPVEPESVKDNPMHEAHLTGGLDCGDCHDPEYPLDHTQSLASCDDCHDKTVVTPVWENHCLTCHHFTYSDETAATDPVRVGELCHD